jgi:hypothetical protein
MVDGPESVAFCGFVCTACSEAADPAVACPGCRAGGGETDCRQRLCCLEQGIDGCWQCERFPCAEGFSSDGHDAGSRGFWVASVQCVRDLGLERYVAAVKSRLGEAFDHADARGLTAEEATELINGKRQRMEHDGTASTTGTTGTAHDQVTTDEHRWTKL